MDKKPEADPPHGNCYSAVKNLAAVTDPLNLTRDGEASHKLPSSLEKAGTIGAAALTVAEVSNPATLAANAVKGNAIGIVEGVTGGTQGLKELGKNVARNVMNIPKDIITNTAGLVGNTVGCAVDSISSLIPSSGEAPSPTGASTSQETQPQKNLRSPKGPGL